MKKLLIITILLASTNCFAQCKSTVFVNQSIVKHDTVFCGNPNRVISVMVDCDTIQPYTSIFVLNLDGHELHRGYEGDKFITGCFGKYEFIENKTYYSGKCTSEMLLRFSIINNRKCNCAER